MHHPSHHHHFHPSSTTSQPLELITDPTASAGSNKWAPKLLRECAQAISDKDSPRIQHLLWMLNELSSPYGDYDEKLASYFLQALFCKATDSGDRSFRTLASAAERSHSFDSARKVILKFQEVSPWTTFGHVASNGPILEAFEGEPKLHIIDISNTYCTQWPTLLESLATRSDDTPHLRLSVVTASNGGSVMKEIGQRMEKFARLMGVPFEFRVVSGFSRLSELKEEDFEVKEDEAVAVNCIGALRRVSVEERRGFVGLIRSLRPKVVTVVEEEADFTSTRGEFVKCFEECLRFYGVFFEMMEESFVPTSNERLMLERESARSILNVLACKEEEGEGDCERREKGVQWGERMVEAFAPVGFSDDAVDDVKALLKRYRPGWSLVLPQSDAISAAGLYLAWKEEAVVWASAWKP